MDQRQVGQRIFRGGKAVYGAPLGILMLDTRFARVPGDMGYAGTWPFPVLYRVVAGASAERVLRLQGDALLDAFIEAAHDLVRQGAEAITTTCGFLALYQRELAAAVAVPVATSSLLQVPWVQATLPPGRRVGIVTISATALGAAHLAAVGAPLDAPIAGTEGGRELYRVLVKAEKTDLDTDLAREDVVAAARSLVQAHPEVGAIVLECTNMPPYAAAVRDAVGLPVFDVYSMISWFQAGLQPRRFEGTC